MNKRIALAPVAVLVIAFLSSCKGGNSEVPPPNGEPTHGSAPKVLVRQQGGSPVLMDPREVASAFPDATTLELNEVRPGQLTGLVLPATVQHLLVQNDGQPFLSETLEALANLCTAPRLTIGFTILQGTAGFERKERYTEWPSEAALQKLLASPHLRRVAFVDFKGLSANAFLSMRESKIETLELNNPIRFEPIGDLFSALAEHATTLRALSISSVVISGSLEPLGQLKQLLSLQLSYCDVESQEELTRALIRMDQLKTLRLTAIHGVDPESLRVAIKEHGSKVEVIGE